MVGKTKSALERLLEKIDRRGPDDCWPWTAGIGTWGYGAFYLLGKNINASRAAYMLLVGPVPDDKVVCHKCDEPICCNPKHLWVGAQADNLLDCRKKGRAKYLYGSSHHRSCAKLTPELVRKARKMYASGISQSEIGRRWGLNSSTISNAIHGNTWGHVK